MDMDVGRVYEKAGGAYEKANEYKKAGDAYERAGSCQSYLQALKFKAIGKDKLIKVTHYLAEELKALSEEPIGDIYDKVKRNEQLAKYKDKINEIDIVKKALLNVPEQDRSQEIKDQILTLDYMAKFAIGVKAKLSPVDKGTTIIVNPKDHIKYIEGIVKEKNEEAFRIKHIAEYEKNINKKIEQAIRFAKQIDKRIQDANGKIDGEIKKIHEDYEKKLEEMKNNKEKFEKHRKYLEDTSCAKVTLNIISVVGSMGQFFGDIGTIIGGVMQIGANIGNDIIDGNAPNAAINYGHIINQFELVVDGLCSAQKDKIKTAEKQRLSNGTNSALTQDQLTLTHLNTLKYT
jgi:tetratricopeptide (TPR) repeat protein